MEFTFLLKRGDRDEWTALNPELLDGEPGVERDTGRVKFGPGFWNDLPYSGSDGGQVTRTAGENLSGHTLVSPRADGTVTTIDPTEPADIDLPVWMTVGAASVGDDVDVLVEGPLTEPSWSWTAGGPIFASATGLPTQTYPTGVAWVRKIGTAETTDTIQFEPDPPIRVI